MTNKKKGKLFEDYSITLLESEGFKLFQRNYIIPGAEIDLIMKRGNKLFLIEVKFRNSVNEFDHVQSYIRKQYFRLRKAKLFLQKKYKFKFKSELWLFLYMQKNKKMIILKRLKLY